MECLRQEKVRLVVWNPGKAHILSVAQNIPEQKFSRNETRPAEQNP